MPQGEESKRLCAEVIEREIAHCRMKVLAWRDVPTNREVLGASGLESCPTIRQVIVQRNSEHDSTEFERALFWARKRIERGLSASHVETVHIASLSSRTIVYKGLMVAPQLDTFFPDLLDPEFENRDRLVSPTLQHQHASILGASPTAALPGAQW